MKKLTFLFLLSYAGLAQSPIKISSYNHVALAVENLGKSTEFYRDIIGLQPVEVPENLKAVRSWFQIAEGQQLHLLLGRKDPVANNDKNSAHYSLTIPANSADEIEAFLKSKNIVYHRQQRFDKAWQIYVADPDGYLIELNEPKK